MEGLFIREIPLVRSLPKAEQNVSTALFYIAVK